MTSLSTSMIPYDTLSFTENHYVPNYFEQIIRPVSNNIAVQKVTQLYFSFYLPANLVEKTSTFTIYLNTTQTIAPKNWTMNTLLIC
jgi:hypothetical protein